MGREETTTGPRQIGIHLPGLIKILGEHLYSEKSVAIRELIQNANDGLLRRREEDPGCPPDLRIDVLSRDSGRELVVRDNGAGMTRREIVDHLATVGSSGTDEFRRVLEARNPEQAQLLIGRFGMGLLSAFVIATSVQINTRSCRPNQPGLTWSCGGGTDYLLYENPCTPIGVEVILQLRDRELADKDTLVSLIRRYADFISFPIHVDNSPLPVNVRNGPWHAGGSTAEYLDYIQKRLGDRAMQVVPLRASGDGVTVFGVLYVPDAPGGKEGEVELYSSRMYVGPDRDLLPGWARFIRGVVESPSLDVTTSREAPVRNAKYAQTQKLVAARLSGFISDLAREDPKGFQRLVKTHAQAVKFGALDDGSFFSLVKDHIEFDSDAGNITIPRYLERVGRRGAAPVRTIYFHEGGVESRQHQLLFAANGIPVLDAEEKADRALIEKYAEVTKGVEAKPITHAADALFGPATAGAFERLVAGYADMDISAKAVSFKPASVPALLVSDDQSVEHEVLKQVLEDPDIPDELKPLQDLIGEFLRARAGGWILYLNSTNEVIQLLSRVKSEEIVTQCMKEIYNSAYLVAAKRLSIHEVERMAEIHTETVALLLRVSLSQRSPRTGGGGGR